MLLLAYSFRPAPTTWVGLAMGVVAAAVLVGLLHPRSTDVFVGPSDPSLPAGHRLGGGPTGSAGLGEG